MMREQYSENELPLNPDDYFEPELFDAIKFLAEHATLLNNQVVQFSKEQFAERVETLSKVGSRGKVSNAEAKKLGNFITKFAPGAKTQT